MQNPSFFADAETSIRPGGPATGEADRGVVIVKGEEVGAKGPAQFDVARCRIVSR